MSNISATFVDKERVEESVVTSQGRSQASHPLFP